MERLTKESMMQPVLVSLALRDIPQPDYADVVIASIPAGVSTDPAHWAREIFDLRNGPRWIMALIMLRQVMVRLMGIPPAGPEVFRVREQAGEEALLSQDDPHLDFRAAVGVDAEALLVRLTTTVRLKNLRGRVYFFPLRLLHGPITQSMVRSAIKRAGHHPIG